MNKYNIQFSKDARNDLLDIYSYIKYNLKEPNIAKKTIQKIKEEIYKLKYSPTMYLIIQDSVIKRQEIRKIKVKNYFVFYKVNEDNKNIEVVRIMYARRNWEKLL